MSRFYFLLISSLFISNSFAQPGYERYLDIMAEVFVQEIDGNTYTLDLYQPVAGVQVSFSRLARLNVAGETMRDTSFNWRIGGIPTSIRVKQLHSLNSKLYICGNIVNKQTGRLQDIFIARLDTNFNIEFARGFSFGHDVYVYDMNMDENGNFYAYFNRNKVNDNVSAISKFNLEGEHLWTYHYFDTYVYGRMLTKKNGECIIKNAKKFVHIDSDGQVIRSLEIRLEQAINSYDFSNIVNHKDTVIYAQDVIGKEGLSLIHFIDEMGKPVKQLSLQDLSIVQLKAEEEALFVFGINRSANSNTDVVCLKYRLSDLKLLRSHSLRSLDQAQAASDLYVNIGDLMHLALNTRFEPPEILQFNRNLINPCFDTITIPEGRNIKASNYILNSSRGNLTPSKVEISWEGYSAEHKTRIECFSCIEPKIEIDSIHYFCEGSSVKLKLNRQFSQVKWSTGESTNSIKIDKAGQYWVKASNFCGEDSLGFSVVEQALPQLNYELNDSSLVPYDELNLRSQSNSQCVWIYNGDSSIESHDTIVRETVDLKYKFRCENEFGCVDSKYVNVSFAGSRIFMPNAFSPNSDGLNDTFGPYGFGISAFELIIYNRWGQQVYRGNSDWDGKFRGKTVSTGKYFYLINYTLYTGALQSERGEISVY